MSKELKTISNLLRMLAASIETGDNIRTKQFTDQLQQLGVRVDLDVAVSS